MPTLRELADRASTLEQRILVYNWLEDQLRVLIEGKKELRLGDRAILREIVDSVLADVLDKRELLSQELKTFWSQPISISSLTEKEEIDEPPAFEDEEKSGSSGSGSKRRGSHLS